MPLPVKILVTGCKGRMGQAVIACSESHESIQIAAQIDIDDNLETNLNECDTVIDFSFHAFTKQLVSACVDQGKSAVVGTTGHSDEELNAIDEANLAFENHLLPQRVLMTSTPIDGGSTIVGKSATWFEFHFP